jgi:two-component system sensor histidine kinase EvgS
LSDFQGLSVLVVDDNRHVRLLVRQMLTSVGVQVFESATPVEALERYRTLTPEVVIVDFEMPQMNGAEFTAKLRRFEAQAGWPRAAILLMTGHGDAARVRAAAVAGVDGAVAKPLSTDLLLRRVATARAQAARARGELPAQSHFRRRAQR